MRTHACSRYVGFFFAVDQLPATVPIALTLMVLNKLILTTEDGAGVP